PFAPDTIQEVLKAIHRLIELTSRYLKLPAEASKSMTLSNPVPQLLDEFRKKASAQTGDELLQTAKDYLHQNQDAKFILTDDRCQKKYGALIFKPAQGYKEYRRIAKYFAADSLIEWAKSMGVESLTREHIERILEIPLYTKWVNAGGQVIPEERVFELFARIKEKKIESWQQVHEFYAECQSHYAEYKARYAIHILSYLYSIPVEQFTPEIFRNIMNDVAYVSLNMLESSITSRDKDYTDFFRTVTFRNRDEMEAVVGKLNESGFLKELKASTEQFDSDLERLFRLLC
ncbi:MAG: DUF4954 family protein, partial [Treponema sp.]|nr:DUF4954 family protein [Treponema sp.]